MDEFVRAIHWIFTARHWSQVHFGTGIAGQLAYHAELSLISLSIAAALAIPAGLVVGHKRRGRFLAVSIANIGRAIPSFALLVLAFIVIGNIVPTLQFSMLPAAIALVLLAIPPILTNTYVGIQSVDGDTVEAARGMGLSERQVLFRLEVPLAAPLIMAGLRTSAVTVVATATLAGYAGGGGLGAMLYQSSTQKSGEPEFIGAAILVAVLALLTEVAFAVMERGVTPRTRSRQKRKARGPVSESQAMASA